MRDTTIHPTSIHGHERRSRPASRLGVMPRGWSGREIVRLQPMRPCRGCRAARLYLWRAVALVVALALAVIVYAPFVRLAGGLITGEL